MRRFFFALLILLTAFRGMVGDAMAYEMSFGLVQQVSVATYSVALSAAGKPANGHLASKVQTSMPCHDAADDEATSASPVCTTCQVCHLTASLPTALSDLPVGHAMRDVPGAQTKPWLSAEQALLIKPPIL